MEGRGFRGGSDEKIRRMWLGLEIVVVGLLSLIESHLQKMQQKQYNHWKRHCIFRMFLPSWNSLYISYVPTKLELTVVCNSSSGVYFIGFWYSISIYKFGLSVCLFVCLFVGMFVSNKRQDGWTDQAHIFCGTSHDPREGLWMIKI